MAPASLLENWKRELERWAPALRVGLYHGAEGMASVQEAAEAWAAQRGGRAAAGGGAFDVIIATYSLFSVDSPGAKLSRRFLRDMTFSHLVLDEAGRGE